MDSYVFDPVEDAFVTYLKGMQPAKVVTNVPSTRPVKFIQLERVGGTVGLVRDSPLMLFRCWDVSRAAAAKFATDTMRQVSMVRTLGGLPVYNKRVVGGPVFMPDPDTNIPRYQFTFQCDVRGKFPTP